MRSEVRLVVWTVVTIAAVVVATTWGAELRSVAPELRTRLQPSKYLYFRNIRSAEYEIRELEGMTLYIPEERSDSGWFQIAVLWREEQAFVVWETPDSLTHRTATRPDGLGVWDPDTAGLATHWWIAFRHTAGTDDAHYVVRDYFEMVNALPEYFDN
jgi:hypothetical protein